MSNKLTHYIIHGANTDFTDPVNQEFYREICLARSALSAVQKGETDHSGVKVLLCYFARQESRWSESTKHDQDCLEKTATALKKDLNPNFKLAVQIASFQNFLEQLAWCDVVYFKGGETKLLVENIENFPDWFAVMKGKTIVASSAGVYFLSKYYYSNDWNELREGTGILDIKVYCHYDPANPQAKVALDALESAGDSLMPIITLPEKRFVQLYQ